MTRAGEIGVGQRGGGLGSLQLRLFGRRIQSHQDVTGLDGGAGGKIDRRDPAGNLGRDGHPLNGSQGPDRRNELLPRGALDMHGGDGLRRRETAGSGLAHSLKLPELGVDNAANHQHYPYQGNEYLFPHRNIT